MCVAGECGGYAVGTRGELLSRGGMSDRAGCIFMAVVGAWGLEWCLGMFKSCTWKHGFGMRMWGSIPAMSVRVFLAQTGGFWVHFGVFFGVGYGVFWCKMGGVLVQSGRFLVATTYGSQCNIVANILVMF